MNKIIKILLIISVLIIGAIIYTMIGIKHIPNEYAIYCSGIYLLGGIIGNTLSNIYDL